MKKAPAKAKVDQGQFKDPEHPYLGPMILLKGPNDACPECATLHARKQPHNQQSLYYQYDFYGKHGRWPTWHDAMAHCSPQVKRIWIRELKKRGVELKRKNKKNHE